MIAIDTNVLVRFLVDDDKEQAERARSLISNNDVLISTTVLLETEWVLRGGYEFAPDQIASGLSLVLGLPQVRLCETEVVRIGMQLFKERMDFADALHLAASGDVGRFATFDRKLIRWARRLPLPIDVIPP